MTNPPANRFRRATRIGLPQRQANHGRLGDPALTAFPREEAAFPFYLQKNASVHARAPFQRYGPSSHLLRKILLRQRLRHQTKSHHAVGSLFGSGVCQHYCLDLYVVLPLPPGSRPRGALWHLYWSLGAQLLYAFPPPLPQSGGIGQVGWRAAGLTAFPATRPRRFFRGEQGGRGEKAVRMPALLFYGVDRRFKPDVEKVPG